MAREWAGAAAASARGAPTTASPASTTGPRPPAALHLPLRLPHALPMHRTVPGTVPDVTLRSEMRALTTERDRSGSPPEGGQEPARRTTVVRSAPARTATRRATPGLATTRTTCSPVVRDAVAVTTSAPWTALRTHTRRHPPTQVGQRVTVQVRRPSSTVHGQDAAATAAPTAECMERRVQGQVPQEAGAGPVLEATDEQGRLPEERLGPRALPVSPRALRLPDGHVEPQRPMHLVLGFGRIALVAVERHARGRGPHPRATQHLDGVVRVVPVVVEHQHLGVQPRHAASCGASSSLITRACWSALIAMPGYEYGSNSGSFWSVSHPMEIPCSAYACTNRTR